MKFPKLIFLSLSLFLDQKAPPENINLIPHLSGEIKSKPN